MKKILVLCLLVLALSTPAQAGRVDPFSWWGQHGARGYATQADDYVIISRMIWDYSQVGFYTIEGDAFKGLRPALTHISGSCYSDPRDGYFNYSATLDVDGKYKLPLFSMASDQGVAAFDLTVYGQVFTLRVDGMHNVIGCNVLFEALR